MQTTPAYLLKLIKQKEIMEKKFYEMPEVEEIDLMLESHILTISVDDEDPGILDGEGDTSDLG